MCLSFPSHELLFNGSLRFLIAKTTTNKTAIPIVSKAPVKSAANGRIDKAPEPSINKIKTFVKLLISKNDIYS